MGEQLLCSLVLQCPAWAASSSAHYGTKTVGTAIVNYS